jgi:hypothetical protein
MAPGHGGLALSAGSLPHRHREQTEPEAPDYVTSTPAGGMAAAPIAAVPLTREEWMLNAQLKAAYKRKLNEFKDCQEKAASDILAHLLRSQ